ncbi:MAG: hypothetical protein HY203_00325 [Nitrospirae bacterium]|nr:hypothetical protein [Nitrospirota bacterium]
MDAYDHSVEKATGVAWAIPLTCSRCSWQAVLYFDPTERQWICHGCLLKIRKQRIRAIIERRIVFDESKNKKSLSKNAWGWTKQKAR